MPEEKAIAKALWLDMEMTGLDVQKDRILEAAAVVTDLNLEVLDEYRCVIFQPPEILEGMDDWCQKTHGENGLKEEVKSGQPLAQAEKELVNFVKRHFGDERAVLAGNSVGHDRKFVDRWMPTLSSLLHYRIIDVSSFKEVFSGRFGVNFEKKENHRARDDIHESIAELRHYLSFVSAANPPAP